ncbi:MAG: universal stress protein [Actinomycetia bacterium]|nr:universal stress protein [Actinomycetes bacterium]MCH9701134.1 universal stress protein [Actinomycetes bacterium]MCH9761640.1 universal stress protein [Actinomycetes bacterium]
MLEGRSTPRVVVGIDGSQSALDAALWAAEEAATVGMSLRLVNVIDSADQSRIDPQELSPRMSAAQVAVRSALAAVESIEKRATIETDIVQGRPVQALLEAAGSAVMLCVGTRGLKHATQGRIGSTAAALSNAARCPVVIVRAHRPHNNVNRAVLIEVDDTARGGVVLRRGLEVARHRGAPVRVLAPSIQADVRAQWQRRLAEWQRRFSDLDITAVSNQGDGLHYVKAHADEIQLIVVSRDRRAGIDTFVGAPGNAALRDSDCSIMVCEPHDAL